MTCTKSCIFSRYKPLRLFMNMEKAVFRIALISFALLIGVVVKHLSTRSQPFEVFDIKSCPVCLF